MVTKATYTARPAVSTDEYIPNLSDPRVKQRVKHALGWASGVLGTEPRELSTRYIDKNLGQAQGSLSTWLRAKLLVCTDSRYSYGNEKFAKEYVLNESGWSEVRAALRGEEAAMPATEPVAAPINVSPVMFDLELVQFWAQNAHEKELKTLDFKYEEKNCARLWHPLQNVRNAAKRRVWKEAGLPFDYDIVSCAPTLIHQRAQQLGMDEYLFGINEFLSSPRAFREHVCRVAGLSPERYDHYKKAKALVNALFCGARLGASEEFALFRLLDKDRSKVRALQADAKLTLLRVDIRTCWKAIEHTLPVARSESGRKLPLSSKRKWALYFQLERTVLNVVRKYLSDEGFKCFLEHDGFRTDKAINTSELSQVVESSIGFRVSFSGISSQELNETQVEANGLNGPKNSTTATYPLVYDKSSEEQRACEIAMNLELRRQGRWIPSHKGTTPSLR